MNKTAYISYSMNCSHLVPDVENLLKDKGYEVSYWIKGTPYKDDCLLNADAVVFILNKFDWGCEVKNMTRGVKNEYQTCVKENKPMYVAYKRKTDNQLLIYDHYFNGTTDVVVAVQGKYLPVYNPPQKILKLKNIKENTDEKLELYN